MTRTIARATNDRGQVVEIKKMRFNLYALMVEGETKGTTLGLLAASDLFALACRAEEDSHD